MSAKFLLVTLLEELQALDYPESELLGPSTFNCGKVDGGVAASAYALCGTRIAATLQATTAVAYGQMLPRFDERSKETLSQMLRFADRWARRRRVDFVDSGRIQA